MLVCFGVSFSHIHHHVILLLLLANVAVAFILGETHFPWNQYSSWKDSLKQVNIIIPSLPIHTCLSNIPLSVGSNTEVMPEAGTFQVALVCSTENHQADLFCAYASSLWRWLSDTFTSGSAPWLLMSCVNHEKYSLPIIAAEIMASLLLPLHQIRHVQCCISLDVKVTPLLFNWVRGTSTFSKTNWHWNVQWSNYWLLRKNKIIYIYGSLCLVVCVSTWHCIFPVTFFIWTRT